MRDFEAIFAIAEARKGSVAALKARLAKSLSQQGLRAIPDERWLLAMARSLFEAGFHWKAIDSNSRASKRNYSAAGQVAFKVWAAQSGRTLTEVSQILAANVDA
jgi:hypothetical protein